MAFFLRLLSTNILRSSSQINSPLLSRSFATPASPYFVPIAKQIELFSNKRSNYVKSNEFNKTNNKPNATMGQFFDLIYTAQTDTDIDQLVTLLKANKKILAFDAGQRNQVLVFNMFYFLDRPDKALQIYNDMDFSGECSLTGPMITKMLMTQLTEKGMYTEAVQVYQKCIEYLKLNNTLSQFKDYDTIDFAVESLCGFGTSEEGMRSLKELTEILVKNKIVLSYHSLIRLVLFSVKQNEAAFALEQLNRFDIKGFPPFIPQNLRCIVHCSLDESEKALKDFEGLVSKSGKMRAFVFSDTITFLQESIARTNYEKLGLKLEQFNAGSIGILKNSLSQELETLVKKNKENKLRLFTERQESKSNQIESDHSNKTTVLKNTTPNENKKPKEDVASKAKQEAPQVKDEVPTIKQGQLFQVLSQLHTDDKFEKITTIIAKYHKSTEFTQGLDQLNINLIINSLFLTNTDQSFRLMKGVFDLCISKNITLMDSSKIQAFLLACIQNEPSYALGISVLTDIEGMSQTLNKNLKTLAYLRYDSVEKALNEVESLIGMECNSFTNEGCVFAFLINNLKNAMKKCKDHKLVSRFDSLIEKITEENRISLVSLGALCSSSNSSGQAKKSLRNVLKEINQGHNDERVADDVGVAIIKSDDKLVFESEKILGDILSEYSRSDEYDYKLVLGKINKFIQNARKNTDLKSLSQLDIAMLVLAHTIRSDLSLSFEEIKSILKSLNDLDIQFKVNRAKLDIFLRIIQYDPIYALELVNEFNKNGKFQKWKPGLFANILCIGFSLIGKSDLALEQIESILAMKVKDTKFNEGNVFPTTISILKEAVMKEDEELKKRLETLLEKVDADNRLADLDIGDVFPKSVIRSR